MFLASAIENSQPLGSFLKSVAATSDMRLAFDTHYDARNWELSWWRGKVLHRMDFQPQESPQVAVTHFKDQFRLLPRFLRWAHNSIPLFPYLAQTPWNKLTTERLPIDKSRIKALIGSILVD